MRTEIVTTVSESSKINAMKVPSIGLVRIHGIFPPRADFVIRTRAEESISFHHPSLEVGRAM
jgi:hypothetical protein